MDFELVTACYFRPLYFRVLISVGMLVLPIVVLQLLLGAKRLSQGSALGRPRSITIVHRVATTVVAVFLLASVMYSIGELKLAGEHERASGREMPALRGAIRRELATNIAVGVSAGLFIGGSILIWRQVESRFQRAA